MTRLWQFRDEEYELCEENLLNSDIALHAPMISKMTWQQGKLEFLVDWYLVDGIHQTIYDEYGESSQTNIPWAHLSLLDKFDIECIKQKGDIPLKALLVIILEFERRSRNFYIWRIKEDED